MLELLALDWDWAGGSSAYAAGNEAPVVSAPGQRKRFATRLPEQRVRPTEGVRGDLARVTHTAACTALHRPPTA